MRQQSERVVWPDLLAISGHIPVPVTPKVTSNSALEANLFVPDFF